MSTNYVDYAYGHDCAPVAAVEYRLGHMHGVEITHESLAWVLDNLTCELVDECRPVGVSRICFVADVIRAVRGLDRGRAHHEACLLVSCMEVLGS